MNKPKYKAYVTDKGLCEIIEVETGRLVARAKNVASLEWIVDELNTLMWAVDRLLKRGPD